MYNYYQPMYLKGRPVTSVDEVRSLPIDFDGSISYFPDIANKKIYTKQVSLDGTAVILVYELKNSSVQLTTEQPSYVTKEEFEKFVESLKEKPKYDF